VLSLLINLSELLTHLRDCSGLEFGIWGKHMIKVAAFIVGLFFGIVSASAAPPLFGDPDLQKAIETLFAPNLDLAEVKFQIDEAVDPRFSIDEGRKEFEALAAKLKAITPPSASVSEKLNILKRFIYESGNWNDNRPFAYNHDDPLGSALTSHILLNYIKTRQGNCMTMPILFMLLGKRIGLDVTLAVAPFHAFVKFTDDHGKVWNVETTSGAGFARDVKYRTDLPMTDLAVEKGTYLRALTHDEVIGVMGTVLVRQLMNSNRPKEAVVVSAVMLKHFPNSAELMVFQASAYAQILRTEILPNYKSVSEMPPDVRRYAEALSERNDAVFAEAEALGWRQSQGRAGVQP
jgi:regulator of sirC expression with transglutaminase-like and TPR domain